VTPTTPYLRYQEIPEILFLFICDQSSKLFCASKGTMLCSPGILPSLAFLMGELKTMILMVFSGKCKDF
jgi:hypothetical protein